MDKEILMIEFTGWQFAEMEKDSDGNTPIMLNGKVDGKRYVSLFWASPQLMDASNKDELMRGLFESSVNNKAVMNGEG